MPPKKIFGRAKVANTPKAPRGKGKFQKEVKVEDQEAAEDVIQSEDERTLAVTEIAKVQTSADIFPTFQLDANIQLLNGLSIVRSLGAGKYEIVNLNAISQNVLGSQETADFIKSDPGRLAAMRITKNEWATAVTKCEIAVRITEKGLFRIFNLSPELREMIIKLVVNPAKGVRYSRNPYRRCNATPLMLSCKQMYEECKKHFWSNNFYADHMELAQIRKNLVNEHGDYFYETVTKMTYHWNDNVRDPTAFRFIARLPNLKELQLDFGVYVFTIHDKYGSRNPNYQHRDEESFGRFRVLQGLDALLTIRGLTRVTINLLGNIPAGEEKTIKKSRDNLVAHLMTVLTQEKPQSKPVPDPKAANGKEKGTDDDSDEEEHDDEGESEVEEAPEDSVYIARKTRTGRTPKTVERLGFENDTSGFLELDDDE